jgi:hypothetical protein
MTIGLQSNSDGSATITTTGGVVNITGNLNVSGATTIHTAAVTPMFSAYQSVSQSLTSGTWTLLQCPIKEFDTTSSYNTSTYLYTPQVAGYYQVTVMALFSSATTNVATAVAKNSTTVPFKQCAAITTASSTYNGATLTLIVYLNGSTDYICGLVDAVGATPTTYAGSPYVYFQAALIARV